MVRIEILAGPEAGRVVEMAPGVWRVGRAKDNDLALAVESVSSRHLQLEVAADGTVRFQDLGSTNGTFSAGVQVKEGEWFAGSELRLGGCALKLLAADESGLLAEAKADDASAHARAAALAGPRRSPARLALVGLLVLGLAGAGVWWFLLRDTQAAGARPAAAAGGPSAAALDPGDLLGGQGHFEDAEAWQLSDGLALNGGELQAGAARGRALLLRNYEVESGGLRVTAEVAGGKAQAVITFGADPDAALPWAAWTTTDLGGGPAELALPEGARWFQLALALEAGARVRGLRAESLERSVPPVSVPPGRLYAAGGNLLLMADEQALLAASSETGAWKPEGAGYAWSGAGALHWILGPGLLAAGGGMLLADGGPVGIAPGVQVDGSPGLLLGSDPRRLLVQCQPAASFLCGEATLRGSGADTVLLTWDLGPALTEAARLAREIVQAGRDGDDPRLLAACSRLLREVPLDEEKNQAALIAQRGALERGQARMRDLQARVSAALLVRSADIMERNALLAEQLAATFAGSPLGEEARGLAEALREAVAVGRQAEQEEQAAWRGRLQSALAASYPLIARWVETQDAAGGGGN